jgi:hypothetical protein
MKTTVPLYVIPFSKHASTSWSPSLYTSSAFAPRWIHFNPHLGFISSTYMTGRRQFVVPTLLIASVALLILMLSCAACGAQKFVDQQALLVHKSNCIKSLDILMSALQGRGARKHARTLGADVGDERQETAPLKVCSMMSDWIVSCSQAHASSDATPNTRHGYHG